MTALGQMDTTITHKATVEARPFRPITQGHPQTSPGSRILTCSCGWWATGPQALVTAAHAEHAGLVVA